MSMLQTHHLNLTIANKIICHDLNLTIHPGEIWGVLGPNGSGKTTLLHALCGLHPTTNKNILLNNISLGMLSSKSIAQAIGILFQDFNVAFAHTVFEHCLAGRYAHQRYFKHDYLEDERIVMQTLKTMELTHLKTKSITQLSGGEKRRLAIATLLAQAPAIYLLDEPTNHLDVRHQMLTLQHFHHLATSQAAAIIMSLHDINLAAQYCDHILLLFPQGETLQGATNGILTEAHLTRLYQHPIKTIREGDKYYFCPLECNLSV